MTVPTQNKFPKIHAYLAHQGLDSRRHIEEWIKAGTVRVNGEKAIIGQRIDPEHDRITVQGKVIKPVQAELVYFLLYKPRGVISTTQDEEGRRSVVDLLPTNMPRLFPVGRLDADSEGLLMMTNDGALTYQLSHPKFAIQKTYQILLDRKISDAALLFLAKGVKLKDGFSKPDAVTVLQKKPDGQWLSITIHEGRNHHVRRMLERSGYEVERLIRTQLGPFSLADLQEKPFIRLAATSAQTMVTSSLSGESVRKPPRAY